eukprot:s416_g21.t1
MPLKLLSGYLYTTSIRYDNRVGVINALHALKGKSQALQPFARMRRYSVAGVYSGAPVEVQLPSQGGQMGAIRLDDNVFRALRPYSAARGQRYPTREQTGRPSTAPSQGRQATTSFSQMLAGRCATGLWDSFIADPNRYGFVVHVCVAVILGKRDELLATDKQFELAEIMQAGPRGTDFEALLRKAFAICAFERHK